MKTYILRLGTMMLDKTNLLSFATRATRSHPETLHAWIENPIWAALIDTGDHKIIYDLGCLEGCMDDENGWPLRLRELFPMEFTEDETIEGQLSIIGIKPTDIDIVVASHLHMDHFGGIFSFGHADVYLPKEDWINALMSTHLDDSYEQWFKRQIEFQVKKYYPVAIGEDFELVPGVDIVTLPGHAPNLLGLLVHMQKDRNMLFVSDAVPVPEVIGPPVRLGGTCYDSVAYRASVDKILKLAKIHDAEIMYSHEMPFFKALKKIPEYYE